MHARALNSPQGKSLLEVSYSPYVGSNFTLVIRKTGPLFNPPQILESLELSKVIEANFSSVDGTCGAFRSLGNLVHFQ